jgi:hypothetical protein
VVFNPRLIVIHLSKYTERRACQFLQTNWRFVLRPQALTFATFTMPAPGASDMGQYFDFGEAAMPDVQQEATVDTTGAYSGDG